MNEQQTKWLNNIKKSFRELINIEVKYQKDIVELNVLMVNQLGKKVGFIFSEKSESLEEILEIWNIRHNQELIDVIKLFLKLANIQFQNDKKFSN